VQYTEIKSRKEAWKKDETDAKTANRPIFDSACNNSLISLYLGCPSE
jgi:hypothetical protein